MLKRISNSLRCLLLVFAVAFVAISSAHAVLLDRVLVVVNDEIITQDDFENALSDMRSKLKSAGESIPGNAEFKEQVLDQLVLEKLLRQRANETGVNISDTMLDKAIENVAKQNDITVTQLLAKLRSEGISEEDFRKGLQNQLLVQSVIDRDIKSGITVLDSEVDGVLRNIPGAKPNRAYNLSSIQLALDENAPPAQIERVKSEASSLRSRILAGDISFEQAVKRYSSAANAEQGGELGWKTNDQLPDLFANVLSKMNQGDISEPIESPAGIFLLKLNEVKGSKQQLVNQTHARHILLKATNKVDISHATKELQSVRDRILSGEDFALIATDISQDTASAIKGGDLGWLSSGDTVAPFEKAMDALQLNEISQPVVSQFGVHLIQVLERRQVDVSDQQRKAMIREQIAKRKIAEKYDQFMKQLKSRAYIDYRVPLDEITLGN